MTILTLGGELGRTLVIGVQGFERPASLDCYDANWLCCTAEVENGAFRGSVAASFTTSDFARFLAELDRVMCGEDTVASFGSVEDVLAFRIELDRAGRATVTGKLREARAGGTELSFSFETDRSFLTTTHANLKAIVAAFPHRSVGV